MKIKKGDTVQIITGNDVGKSGRVIKVFPIKEKIIVEGLNMVKKHARPTQENPQGGIMEKEAAVHIETGPMHPADEIRISTNHNSNCCQDGIHHDNPFKDAFKFRFIRLQDLSDGTHRSISCCVIS